MNTHSTKRAACTAKASGNDQWHVTSSHCNTSNQVFYCHVPNVGRCWWDIHKDHFDRISPRLVGWARAALATKRFPTSGMMALLLALHSCNVTQVTDSAHPTRRGVPSTWNVPPTARIVPQPKVEHGWHDMETVRLAGPGDKQFYDA